MINIYINDNLDTSQKFSGWKFVYPEIHFGAYAFTDEFINLILELEMKRNDIHIFTRNADLIFSLILNSINNNIYLDENNFSIYINQIKVNSNDFILRPHLFVRTGSMYFSQKLHNLFGNKSDITQTKSLSEYLKKKIHS